MRSTSTHTLTLALAVLLLLPAAAGAQDPSAEAAVAESAHGPPTATTPTEDAPISLEQAVDKALAQNPQILAGELSIEAAVSARKSARSNFFPLLTSDLTFLYYSEKPGFGDVSVTGDFTAEACEAFTGEVQLFCQGMFTGMEGMGDAFQSKQYDLKITITVAQPLTPLYQAYQGHKLAELGVDVASIELEKTKTDLTMHTIEAYYGYLKARAAKKSIEEAIVGVEAHVKKAEAFFAADFMTKNDLLQAQVRLAQLRGSQLEVEQGVALAQEGLLIMLNEPPGTPLAPADKPDMEKAYLEASKIPDQATAFDLAEKNRPELRQMSKTIEQAGTAVKLAAGGYIPSVSAFGSFQHQEGSVMELPEFLVGASLNWNIFQFGKVYYKVDEAKAHKAAAEAAYEALERAMKLEVQQALLSIELAEKKIEINEEAVAAAQEQLRIENERYDKQVTTTTEVLDATTRLVQAQVELATTHYDYLLAIARLRKACGTL